MKKFLFVLAAVSVMFAACTSDPLEVEEEVEVKDGRTTIPYKLNAVGTGTKVSYAGGTYAIASGDQIRITGKTRTDIEGLLSQGSSNNWSGSLSYETAQGAPDGSTELVATLIHSANSDYSTYANAIISSTVENQLQYAVEHYSLFTTEYNYGTTSIVLTQKASFLDVNVTFDFDGTHQMGDTGEAEVDLETSRGTASGKTVLNILQNGEDYISQFLAVVPAGVNVQDITLSLSDRPITFENSAVLAASKKYTVNRTLVYRPVLGDPFWSDGTYGRFPHEDGVNIVGIIVYVNRHSADQDEIDLDNAITEADNGGGHALVMALHNASTSGQKWKGSADNKLYTTAITSPSNARSKDYISGYANTVAEYAECNAASLAKNYEGGTNYSGHTTGWFLPSIGQWFYSIITYGEADPIEQWTDNDGKNYLQYGNWSSLVRVKVQSTNTDNLLVQKLNDRLELLKTQYGITYDLFGMTTPNGTSDNYWTSSESDASNAIRMNFGSVEEDAITSGKYYSTIKTKPESKGATYSWKPEFIMKVRPFLAF